MSNDSTVRYGNPLDMFLSGELLYITTTNLAQAKLYVKKAASRGITVKVTELGAGVKRIARAARVCPHCKGKGYLA